MAEKLKQEFTQDEIAAIRHAFFALVDAVGEDIRPAHLALARKITKDAEKLWGIHYEMKF